ncbi:ATP-binding cassette sub-family C member Sur isoform X3 [Sitodiplosis mosellana]|nr:ATP-binding cassette sub-family C member Sur isoform X3 [Sitodiplosis mosellana]
MKAYWKLFVYGGLLKLLADVAGLVGPVSITRIVEYIQLNLSASSLLTTAAATGVVAAAAATSTAQNGKLSNAINGTDATAPITHSDMTSVVNDAIKTGSNSNYYVPLSAAQYRMSSEPGPMMSALLINENTEIYYPTWPEFVENGWIMALLVLLATLAQGSFSQASTHIVNMIGIRLRTSLQCLVYRKTLLISSSCFTSPNSFDDSSAHSNDNENSNGSISTDAHETYYANNETDDNNGATITEQGINTTTMASATIMAHSTTITDDKIKPDLNDTVNKSAQQQQQQQQQQLHDQTVIDTGTITNLMSEDALNIMFLFYIAHYVWAIPLKIAFCMYLLYQMLGISAIIGSTVCIATMIPLQFFIGKKMSNNAKLTASNTDERLRRISELLMGIKIIKLNAWETVFTEKISKSRENELKCLDKDSIYWTLMTFLTHLSSIIITFVTFAVFLSMESNDVLDKFTTGRVFAALALFNQLTVPLFIFPITIPMIISAIVSTRRLEGFLRQPEVQKEFEGIRNMAHVMSRSDASLDVFEIDENDGQTIDDGQQQQQQLHTNDDEQNNDSQGSTTNEALLLSKKPLSNKSNFNTNNTTSTTTNNDYQFNNDFYLQDIYENQGEQQATIKSMQRNFNGRRSFNASVKLKKNNKISESMRMDRNRPRQKSLTTIEIQMEIPNELVISVRNAVFSWRRHNTTDPESPLRIDRLDIPRGKLTVIVGKSGSGKTSLLAAILKEMRLVSGELIWNKYATIAYVQQTPWLMKTTIRENILFGEAYRPRRYEKVLVSCALKEDLRCLPDGDLTEIGTNSINLSGGQKSRIAIARALYSSANVVIMDDPLSSLDNEVSKWIFDNSIKNMLLKHQRTVILVTQKTNLVHHSDYIISMENNSIRAKGTYRVIESKDYELIQEWNSIIAKENAKDENVCTRTARERWKLFKNISKIGLQRQTTNEENEIQTTPFSGCKRKPSIYGSSVYGPFPMDECNIDEIEIQRRPSKRHPNQSLFARMSLKKSPLRTNSLNVRERKPDRMPVTRNISSPSTMQHPISGCSSSNNHRPSTIETMRNFDFRQFLSRMSFKRMSRKNSRLAKPLSATNSVRNPTLENSRPVKRIMSTISKHSEEAEDDEICSDYNEDRLIYDEERKYGKIPAKIYLLYLKSCGLWTIGVFCLSALAWQATKIYLDVWLRDWTDIEQTNRFTDISYYFGIYGLLSVICVGFSMISVPFGQYAGSKARRSLHEQLLQSIVQKSIYFFQTTPFGRMMNRFSSDMAVIDKKIAATSQRLLQFVLLCLCSILLNAVVTPWFIVLTLPIVGAYYIVQKFYRYSSRELQRLESITNSPILTHFAETIQGVATIRAYNQESRFMEILLKRMEANNIAVIMQNTSNRWLGIALDYLGGVIVFVSIVTALLTSQMYPEAASPSLVALAINYTLLVPIYLNWVVKLLADLEMYIGAVERISLYINPNDKGTSDNDTDESPCELMAIKPKEKYKAVPISWPHRGDITFENVSLRYENQPENIVTNLNLVIPAGQRLGICGRSGSGKSTLAMALFRVVDIVSGRIFIDNVNIATIHTDEIRTRLSIIPQDVMLFNGSIRENLDPSNHYTDLDLWNSLEMAQLKQAIISMPAGLDTTIVDNGSNVFSGGEKQLFCLARAVLRGSVCLVLDEATSSLDATTESALLDAANKAFHGRTIITIAHRLTTLLNYDRIIVMENGKIVEEGTPDQLRHKVGGKFSSMLYSSVQSYDSYYIPDEKL